jgi:cytochrome oxidase Cu insertion factor (SCO1/SenC/PrrC family)
VSGLAVVFGAAVAGPIILLGALNGSGVSEQRELAYNTYLDPGTPISGAAPTFTLSDQFGPPVSLDSYRGKVVLLAFTDSECTTICPMTTTAMLDAKAMLGKAGSQVQLLGIDANPASTSLEDVWSYSELHGMLRQWHFLTGSLAQLRRVWKAYGVEAATRTARSRIPRPVRDWPRGERAKVYLTQQSYSAVGQFGSCWPRRHRACFRAIPTCARTSPMRRFRRSARPRPSSCLGPAAAASTSVRAARCVCTCSSPRGIRKSPAWPGSSTRSTAMPRRRLRRASRR